MLSVQPLDEDQGKRHNLLSCAFSVDRSEGPEITGRLLQGIHEAALT